MGKFRPRTLIASSAAAVVVALVIVGVAVAVGGARAQGRLATANSGWWWTQDWAASEVALRWGGGAPYWNIGCAGIGPRRYFDVAATAVGPSGQKIGVGRGGSSWKWQHFRCLRLYRRGWTAFELYVLGGYSFKVAPPKGARYVVARPIVFR